MYCLFLWFNCVVFKRGLWGIRNGGRICSVVSVILYGEDCIIYVIFKGWVRKKGK